MRLAIFPRFRAFCAAILARSPRPGSSSGSGSGSGYGARFGLGLACYVFIIMALMVLVISAMIPPTALRPEVAPPHADMSIIHRMMQDQRAISRATRTYTLSTFAERFGHKGD